MQVIQAQHERPAGGRGGQQVRTLAAASGLGRRVRRVTDDAGRARQAVTKAIRTALARLDGHAPALAAHLRAAVRTGLHCSYAPDPRAPATGQLAAAPVTRPRHDP